MMFILVVLKDIDHVPNGPLRRIMNTNDPAQSQESSL